MTEHSHLHDYAGDAAGVLEQERRRGAAADDGLGKMREAFAAITAPLPADTPGGAGPGDVLRAYAARLGGWLRKARYGAAARRPVIVSALMVAAGLGLACVGGWLIGTWCLGLVVLAIGAGAVYMGLARDDHADLPRRGARTVDEHLDEELMRQRAADAAEAAP